MKKKLLIGTFLLFLLLLSACGGTPTATSTEVPAIIATKTAIEPTASPTSAAIATDLPLLMAPSC